MAGFVTVTYCVSSIRCTRKKIVESNDNFSVIGPRQTEHGPSVSLEELSHGTFKGKDTDFCYQGACHVGRYFSRWRHRRCERWFRRDGQRRRPNCCSLDNRAVNGSNGVDLWIRMVPRWKVHCFFILGDHSLGTTARAKVLYVHIPCVGRRLHR